MSKTNLLFLTQPGVAKGQHWQNLCWSLTLYNLHSCYHVEIKHCRELSSRTKSSDVFSLKFLIVFEHFLIIRDHLFITEMFQTSTQIPSLESTVNARWWAARPLTLGPLHSIPAQWFLFRVTQLPGWWYFSALAVAAPSLQSPLDMLPKSWLWQCTQRDKDHRKYMTKWRHLGAEWNRQGLK